MNRNIFLCAAVFFATANLVFSVDGIEVGMHVERGYAALKDFENEAAIGAFNQALRLDPNNAKAYNGRAIAYQRLKAYDQALRDFSAAIKVNPLYSEAMHNRDVLIDMREKKSNPVDDYNSYLNYYPDYGAAQRTDAFTSIPNAGTGGVGNRVIPTAESAFVYSPYSANGNLYLSNAQPVNTAPYLPGAAASGLGAPSGGYKIADSFAVTDGYAIPFSYSQAAPSYYIPQTFVEMQDHGEPIDPNADTARSFRNQDVITHKPYVVVPQSSPLYNNSGTTDEFVYQDMSLNNVNTATPQVKAPVIFTGAQSPSFAAGFVQTETARSGIAFDINMSAIRHNQLRQYHLAIEELNRAIKMDTSDPIAFNNRGYAYALLDNYPAALNDFNTALFLNPYYSDAQSNRSIVLKMSSR